MSGAAPQRSVRKRGPLRAVEDELAQPGDGAERVRLKFLPEGAEVTPDHEHDAFDWWPAEIDEWPAEAGEALPLVARWLTA